MKSYCLRCKSHTDSHDMHEKVAKNGRVMMHSTCSHCSGKKCRALGKKGGSLLGSVVSGVATNLISKKLGLGVKHRKHKAKGDGILDSLGDLVGLGVHKKKRAPRKHKAHGVVDTIEKIVKKVRAAVPRVKKLVPKVRSVLGVGLHGHKRGRPRKAGALLLAGNHL